jgi:hypothetical protein
MNTRSCLALLGAGLLAAGLPAHADAQLLPSLTMTLASGPVLVNPGEHVLSCFHRTDSNSSPAFLMFTFDLVFTTEVPLGSGGTAPSETVLKEATLSLPPLGSPPHPPRSLH